MVTNMGGERHFKLKGGCSCSPTECWRGKEARMHVYRKQSSDADLMATERSSSCTRPYTAHQHERFKPRRRAKLVSWSVAVMCPIGEIINQPTCWYVSRS